MTGRLRRGEYRCEVYLTGFQIQMMDYLEKHWATQRQLSCKFDTAVATVYEAIKAIKGTGMIEMTFIRSDNNRGKRWIKSYHVRSESP